MMKNDLCFLRVQGVQFIYGFNTTLSGLFAKFLGSMEFFGFEAGLHPSMAGIKDLIYWETHGASFSCVHEN